MNFNLEKTIEILERTPKVLTEMLGTLSDEWTSPNEGGETWSAYDVVGHLIEGEKTDWVSRMKIILSENSDKSFVPFNRFAQFEEGAEKSLSQLLAEFAQLRKENIEYLMAQQLSEEDLEKKGIHPAFGEVSLAQLLATWTVHDLNHIVQISRVMAHQYKSAVGPWIAYLRVLE